MFCSDDKHPDDLQVGHINRLVARAVAYGHNLFDVLQTACMNPIKHYNLAMGKLGIGDRMDAVLVDNLKDFRPIRTWLSGNLVAEQGQCLLPSINTRAINCFNARRVTKEDFKLVDKNTNIRVIKAIDGDLLTNELTLKPKVKNGQIIADIKRDILWICVVNRYQAVKPAFGFIQGFALKKGGLASSVAHDSHNVIAVATNLDSLCEVVNTVIKAKGGIAATNEKDTQLLPLPIAGLMSDEEGDIVANNYAQLDAYVKKLGTPLRAPFMTLSFMALLVIPELKLSDQGLFDARDFKFTPVIVNK